MRACPPTARIFRMVFTLSMPLTFHQFRLINGHMSSNERPGRSCVFCSEKTCGTQSIVCGFAETLPVTKPGDGVWGVLFDPSNTITSRIIQPY